MKKFYLLCIMLLNITACFAQYSIGYTTTVVNLRECASTECGILCKIPMNGNIFVFTEKEENGFYRAIYIDKDIEGYISNKYIKLTQKVNVNQGGTLQKIGESDKLWPTISIENDCNVKTTLRLNSKTYYLKPHEKRDIASEPGQVLIIASSPGIIPYVSADVLENNAEYWWKFYVVSYKSSSNDDRHVYISSTDGRYYHKTTECLYINGNGNLKRISVKDAMNKDLEPCKYCFDIDRGY